VLEIYALRWGIEVYFKEAKQKLGFLKAKKWTYMDAPAMSRPGTSSFSGTHRSKDQVVSLADSISGLLLLIIS
jgi:hypothetical protein